MASNDSNTSFCPVCSKSFNAKQPKKAIKSHIECAAASSNTDTSTPHQQWIDQHSARDRDRRKARLYANSKRLTKWRASHPEKTKQQNEKARIQRKLERKRKWEDQPATDHLGDLPPTPPPARSDSHLMANPYYLLSLLSVVINPAAYMVAEVQNSLHEIEQLLGQSGSEVCNIIKIPLTNANCHSPDPLESS